MTNSFIYYVLESTFCMLLFLIVYRLLIANLTLFTWMRFYLIVSVVLSLILPVIIIPVQWNSSFHISDLLKDSTNFLVNQPDSIVGRNPLIIGNQLRSGFNLGLLILNILLAIYCIGLVYKAYNLVRNMRSIRLCIKENQKVREGHYWIVNINNEIPAFSFFNYIFVNNNFKKLSVNDMQQIRDHELVHVKQYHSLDILFIELTSIVFWFNPLMKYLKRTMQEIHEYIVDEKIAGRGEGKKDYAQLLLKLASEIKGFNLSAGFSGSQIKRRIVMISRQRSLPGRKLMFIVLVPLTVLLMLSFSYLKNPDPLTAQTKQNENVNQSQLKIGKIIWKGNTVYDIKTLNHAFGLKQGSVYNKSLIGDRLNGTKGAQDAVSNLYQDFGYLTSRITFDEKQNKETVDLTITIYEGKQAKFHDIIVKINGKVTKDPVSEIGIQTGDLFSKAKIIKSIEALAASGKYDPEKINPKPFLNVTTDEFDNVDLLFELTKISNKN